MQKLNKALLIIDMINHFQFEGGPLLLKQTTPVAKNIVELKKRAIQAQIPVIYVNDNFKNWQGDIYDHVEYCLNDTMIGKEVVKMIKPEKGDYHILKPSYSGFYATPLHLLLEHLNVESLILTGIAGNMCVHFTANDAFMLKYQLHIPSDCVASETNEANENALKQMKLILKADLSPSDFLQI